MVAEAVIARRAIFLLTAVDSPRVKAKNIETTKNGANKKPLIDFRGFLSWGIRLSQGILGGLCHANYYYSFGRNLDFCARSRVPSDSRFTLNLD